MKHFLIRLVIYAALLGVIFSTLGAPNDTAPHGSGIGFYVGFYGVAVGFWILLFEGVYQLLKRLRKPPTPIPDTQPLSAIQHANNPTRPIDKP